MSNIKGSVTDEDKDIRELIKIYYCFFFFLGEVKCSFFIYRRIEIFSLKKYIYIYNTLCFITVESMQRYFQYKRSNTRVFAYF